MIARSPDFAAKPIVESAEHLQALRKPVDNALAVETPENISFDYRVAGPSQRLLSFLLDFVIVQCLYWILFLLILIFGGMFLFATGPLSEFIAGAYFFLGLVGAFLVYWFYGAIMETLYHGRTWGKMICRQRVLDSSGSSITASQALIRNFFRAIDTAPIYMLPIESGVGFSDDTSYFPIPTALFGLIAMCCTRDYRRLGDLLAGTIVVREESKYASKPVRFDDPRVFQLAELIPPSFVVDRQLARTLASYVERRLQLGPARSDEIAKHLSSQLIEIFGMLPDTNPDLLLCSLYYRTFHDLTENNQEAATPAFHSTLPNMMVGQVPSSGGVL
jgi:uncharacterized RDD family membrane protein YckC